MHRNTQPKYEQVWRGPIESDFTFENNNGNCSKVDTSFRNRRKWKATKNKNGKTYL